MSSRQADITLHTERADGSFSCEGFSGFPSERPYWIVLSACENQILQPLVQDLRQELVSQIHSMAPGIRKTPPVGNCPRQIHSPIRGCQVSRTYPDARKLLVLIGDSGTPISATTLVTDWLAAGPSYRVMPVYPAGVVNLPPELDHLQISSWQAAIAEMVPGVMAAAGIGSENFRIFISYKRDDVPQLAEQLHHALSKAQFDVFLDRFSIPPAANFQTRLRQELADKAMVLVLESARAGGSQWIRNEVGFARKNRLGLMALTLPGAPPVRGVREKMRTRVSPQELRSDGCLKPPLDQLIQRVQREHQRAIVRRRYFLRQSLTKALLFAGAGAPYYFGDGAVRASSSTPPVRHYGAWLTPRPPELADFHTAHSNRQPAGKEIVIGPADALEPNRRARLDWLAQETGVGLDDEGHMLRVARLIAQGRL